MAQPAALILALLALPALHVLAPQPALPRPVDGNLHPLQMVLCIIDVNQAINSLALGGTSLRDTILVCEPPFADAERQAGCTVALTNLIYFIAQTSSYISAAASDCAATANLPAYCAADITNLILSLSGIANTGSSIMLTCRRKGDTDFITTPSRRLEADEIANFFNNATEYLQNLSVTLRVEELAKRNRQTSITNCFFNAVQAADYVIRAGLALNQGIQHCQPLTLHTDGVSGQMTCSVDITGVINSLSYAAQAIGYVISQCPVGVNLDAVCAGDIAGMIGAMAGVAASGSSLTLTCGKIGKPDESEENHLILPGVR